ncbi:hypothetical protein K461DRAFT_220613 [Myriangium duriaei CBS 260.36]|uniref:Increased loss of mitochondrial DNA protein 1 n=1 Tax=Myriangium duriaei CBS 260.36 TaxID=1168546 RepID=A0A9P4JB24_9PEZI|nr:hypothetical protein K461DRAFT_220613 [Myriangium duriaei CBS 260.36]
MAILSAFTIIRGLSLFHLTAAYFLLVSPSTLTSQPIVLILGDAMQLPETRDFSRATEATSLCGLILGVLALSDLVAASLPDLTAVEYWLAQVPVRLLVLFGVGAYPLLFKEGGMFGPQPGLASNAAGFASAIKRDRTPSELLINNLIFTTGFVEVSIWFWVFVLLRDERRNLAVKMAQRQKEHAELADR